MIQLLMIFRRDEWGIPEKLSGKEEFIQRSQEMVEHGVCVYTSASFQYDREKKVFQYATNAATGEEVLDFHPDIVRSRFGSKDFFHYLRGEEFPLINKGQLSLLTRDKLTTALLFPERTIPTVLLSQRSPREVSGKTTLIVKERYGYGGKGIQTYSVSQLQAGRDGYDKPSDRIVQPLLITKALIASKMYQNLDLRFLMIGESTPKVLLRTMQSENPTSKNIDLRESLEIPYNELEQAWRDAVSTIHRRVKKLVKNNSLVYSIDLFQSDGRIYLIELNSAVGFISMTSVSTTSEVAELCQKMV